MHKKAEAEAALDMAEYAEMRETEDTTEQQACLGTLEMERASSCRDDAPQTGGRYYWKQGLSVTFSLIPL